jgi:D-hexose-6-phosphate mutarotase
VTSSPIAAFNERYGVANRIQFAAGHGGLEKLDLRFADACAEVYLQGAHVTHYQPCPNHDVLWMSDSAVYQPGAALRGGIPICWPWFGAATVGRDRPQHGYARTSDFRPISSRADEACSSVVLALDTVNAPYPEWRNKLQLELEIRLQDSLWMELRSQYMGLETITVSNALHNYFAISSKEHISIPTLTGLRYLDKLQDYQEYRQSQPVVFDGEVDRVYRQTPARIELQDSGWHSVTTIETWGNNNLVVWNPGAEKAKAMSDFTDNGYQHMVCIEPANALAQSLTLQPGADHRLGQCISIRQTD